MEYFMKIMPGEFKGEKSIKNVIKYILNEQKNPHGIHNVYGTSNEDIKYLIIRFVKVQKRFRKTSNKRIIHLIVSFKMDCPYTPKDYMRIGNLVACYYKDYQVIFALHEKDKCKNVKQPHLHFAINPISFKDGNRIRYNKTSLKEFHKYLKIIITDTEFTLQK